MNLDELADVLRVLLGESFGGAMSHRSSSFSKHHHSAPTLPPEAYKRKWGRCPPGYNADDEGHCKPIEQTKGGPAGPHGEPAATVKQVPFDPSKAKDPAATVKQVKLPDEPKKSEPAAPAHAEPAKHSGVRKALHHVWEAVSDPFKKMYKLATDKKYRTEVKDFVVKACKKEGTQTKEMAGHIARALKGEKLTTAEKGAVMDQMADIVKMALLGGLAGHMASGGLVKLAATLASPADELAGIAIDKPLRAATKKIFGREHGILPTSFYEEGVLRRVAMLITEAYKEGDEYKVIEKMVDAIIDEMSKAGLSDDDIEAALVKSGLRGPKKKSMIAKITSMFSKKEHADSVLMQAVRELL